MQAKYEPAILNLKRYLSLNPADARTGKRHGAIHQLTISTILGTDGHRRSQPSPWLRLTSSNVFSFPFHAFLLKMLFPMI
jgi:hypothetical protein